MSPDTSVAFSMYESLGAIEAEQIENGKRTLNNRLIDVAVNSYAHQDVQSIDDLSKTLLDQLEEFFISYNKSRGKKFKVKGRSGPKRAAQLLEAERFGGRCDVR